MKEFLPIAAVALWIAGCATSDTNPLQARANTGYLDFHADQEEELNWDLAHFDERTQAFQRLYSKLESPPDGVLRLAIAPGVHRLRVSFLNRVVVEPAVVQVEVKDGMVTPVRVKFTEEGTALVQRSEKQRGATAKGGFRSRTKFSADESSMYRLSAEAGASVPYQPRERVPSAR